MFCSICGKPTQVTITQWDGSNQHRLPKDLRNASIRRRRYRCFSEPSHVFWTIEILEEDFLKLEKKGKGDEDVFQALEAGGEQA